MRSQRVVDLRNQKPQAVRKVAREPERKRQSPILKKRRRNRHIFVAATLVIVLVCAIAAHFLSFMSGMRIQGVSLSGSKAVDVAVLKDFIDEKIVDSASGYLSGRNMFFFDTGALENEILVKFPRIRTVHVVRSGFLETSLSIDVSERVPFAKWCVSPDAVKNDGPCFLMDRDGFIFAIADPGMLTEYSFLGSLSSTNDPIGLTFGAGHFPGILSLLDFLGQAGFTPTGATIIDDRDFTIPIVDSFYLKVSFGERASDVIKNLKLVLSAEALKDKSKNLDYVDLRFGNRVYYKFKGIPEAAH